MKQFTRVEPTTVQEVGVMFRREVVIKRFQTDDGLQHEFTTFFRDEDAAVSVVALTTDGQVVMVRQFRPGPEKWLYDFPGGDIQAGELFEQAARRELAEETGYAPGELHYLGDCTESAYMNGRSAVFLATNCVYEASRYKLDQTERDQGAEVCVISLDELFRLAGCGELCFAGPLALALKYLMNIKGESHE